MYINLIFDTGGTNDQAPAAYKNAVQSVAAFFDHLFSADVTINITVGWGEFAGNPIQPGALGNSLRSGAVTQTFGQVASALNAIARTPDERAAVANDLSGPDPFNGASIVQVWNADAKALGLIDPHGTNIDGAIGFATNANLAFDPDHRAVNGLLDFYGIAAHEISEILGRFSQANNQTFSTVMDLFRYQSNGVRAADTRSPAFFSLDHGQSSLGLWNTTGQGDWGDWDNSTVNDCCDANAAGTGQVLPWSFRDTRLMDAMGYHRVAIQSDYTGAANADILLHDTISGAVSLWVIQQGQFAVSTMLGGIPSGMRIVGNGDFNGDGCSDILLRDPNGALVEWFVQNGQFAGSTQLGGVGGNIQVAATADFNQDGTADVLLRDTSTGAISIWTVNNGQFAGSRQIGGMGGNLQIVGTGNFSGNGENDLLLRDTTSGAVSDWTISNGQFTGTHQFGGIGANFDIAGVGDFTGTNQADILLRDRSTGAVSYWAISNNNFVSSTQIGGLPSNIDIAGVRDLDGTGISDILLHDNNSGSVFAWTMLGGNYNHTISLGSVGAAGNVQISG